MLFFLKCPQCQDWVQVDSQHQGSMTKCRACQAHFIIPPPPSVAPPLFHRADLGPPTERLDPPPPRHAESPSAAPEQADDSEHDQDHDEAAAGEGDEPEGDDAPSADAAPVSWQKAYNGLTLFLIGMLLYFGAVVLFVIVQFGLRSRFDHGDFFGGGASDRTGLMCVIGLVYLAALGLAFAGQCMGLTAPAEANARGCAALTVIADVLAGFLILIVVVLQADRFHFGGFSGGLAVAALLAMIALTVALIAWLEYLRRVTLHFGNTAVGQSARLLAGVVICFNVTNICMGLLILFGRFNPGDVPVALVNAVAMIVIFGWLLALIVQTRQVIVLGTQQQE